MSSAAKKIIPLMDRILVQRLKASPRTASGIYIPEKAQENLNEGIVVAVGPGAVGRDGKIQPPTLQPNDRVILPQFAGQNVRLAGQGKESDEELIIYRESEILAKLAQ
ncbi:chaperonin Cpn10 [Paraphysoderma sedebokerense]|nr:chaperonin Cpn10 [Paraphysoderma sedebokerense]